MWLKFVDGRLINLDLVTDITPKPNTNYYTVRFVTGNEWTITSLEYQIILTTLSKAKMLSIS